MPANTIDEMVTTLYEMIQDAGGIPLMGDRCVIEREKALDILDEIRANIPSDLKMAREIVEKRNEMITAGKREAEVIRKQAEEVTLLCSILCICRYKYHFSPLSGIITRKPNCYSSPTLKQTSFRHFLRNCSKGRERKSSPSPTGTVPQKDGTKPG